MSYGVCVAKYGEILWRTSCINIICREHNQSLFNIKIWNVHLVDVGSMVVVIDKCTSY